MARKLTATQLAAKRKALGQRLATQRKAMGLTQKDVAARTGLSQAKVSNTERGLLDAQMSTWMRMAHVLGVEVDIPLPPDGESHE